MTSKRRLLALAVVLAGGAVVALFALETRAVATQPLVSVRAGLGPPARFSARFPLYALGESFEGLPLTAITSREDAPAAGERVPANYVGFIYGDCVARSEQGCPPPLEVQIWPACVRSLADYSLTPAGAPLPHESTMVRGVPAALFEEGLRLELYTGDVTIVVFGLERAQIQRAAAALRAANALASSAPMLPPPVAGAIAGTLRCS
jgi:hypothetical protein